jgi:hypothetical protein
MTDEPVTFPQKIEAWQCSDRKVFTHEYSAKDWQERLDKAELANQALEGGQNVGDQITDACGALGVRGFWNEHRLNKLLSALTHCVCEKPEPVLVNHGLDSLCEKCGQPVRP